MTTANRLGGRISVLVLAFVLAACQTVPRHLATQWELPAGVKTLMVNGYPMAFLEAGKGQAVVLVHGAGVDYRSWRNQTASPPDGFRLIAVSLRHHYPERWDGKGDTFSTKQHAADLAAFTEAMGAGAVYLVAHSLGSIPAFRMAQARPDLVKRLVLMDPIFHSLVASPAKPPEGGDRLGAVLKDVKVLFAQGNIEGGLEAWVDRDVPGTWKRRSEESRQVSRENAWTLVGVNSLITPVTCAEIGSLNMPVLLITGQKTPRRLANTFAATHKCMPAAQRVVIPAAGHSMHVDNPAAFEAALVKFLSN
ncbi:MAG: hypothetical protein EWM73_02748 [Nitrospira sp.]|nr:MAG: hypothetical protein EWM73_02748 [Nitrospira sp.]